MNSNLIKLFIVWVLCVLTKPLTILAQTEKPLTQYPLQYARQVAGNFSFIDSWNYPMGVYKRENGTLGCDGWCPSEVGRFKDSVGNVLPQFRDSFYSYVDTSHVPVTCMCDAWAYGWGLMSGIDYRKQGDSLELFSIGNAGNYSHFQFLFHNNQVSSWVEFYPPFMQPGASPQTFFAANKLHVIADSALLKQGIYKLNIDAEYEQNDIQDKSYLMYFKGVIYIDTHKKYHYSAWKKMN